VGFSQASILDVSRPIQRAGSLFVSWRSSAPAGTWFQIYVGRKLAWWGTTWEAEFPLPPGDRTRIDIGAVGDGEAQTDFSASLPGAPSSRALLTWSGGSYLDGGKAPQGFRIYGESAPGGGIDYARPLGFVAAYEGGQIQDGFGDGGFGDGGFGYSASYYRWTSGELRSGTWGFAVMPVDAAGNEGAPSTAYVPITAAPMAPARGGDGKRLRYTYSSATKRATLNWLASPG
jgi:hypothetical protein